MRVSVVPLCGTVFCAAPILRTLLLHSLSHPALPWTCHSEIMIEPLWQAVSRQLWKWGLALCRLLPILMHFYVFFFILLSPWPLGFPPQPRFPYTLCFLWFKTTNTVRVASLEGKHPWTWLTPYHKSRRCRAHTGMTGVFLKEVWIRLNRPLHSPFKWLMNKHEYHWSRNCMKMRRGPVCVCVCVCVSALGTGGRERGASRAMGRFFLPSGATSRLIGALVAPLPS